MDRSGEGIRVTIDSRRTPCVGICSTTYGDLVCRGCRRFAHEIVDWNAYSDAQRVRVWERLIALRDAATATLLEIVDEDALATAVAELRLPNDTTPLSCAFELLRRRARTLQTLDAVGLRAVQAALTAPVAIRDAIDAEFHRRSVAAYERNFRVVVE